MILLYQWFSEPMHALPIITISLIHCCKQPNYSYNFCISPGSVATVFKWGKQKYNHLRYVSTWCRMPKIIKIGQCFTELLKNNTGTVFSRHGVYLFGIAEWDFVQFCWMSCCTTAGLVTVPLASLNREILPSTYENMAASFPTQCCRPRATFSLVLMRTYS